MSLQKVSRHTPVTLTAGDLVAVFLPGLGLVGRSLRHRGDELLGRAGELAAYVEHGSTFGLPLLHPWANRLEGFRYRVAGRSVELDPASPLLHLDRNGLPIHGVPGANLVWDVVEQTRARLVAALDWTGRELLGIFPFPHRLLTTVDLDPRGLGISTELTAHGGAPVPVSFGFHPYLRLPGEPRSDWRLELPPMTLLVLDGRGLPTGAEEPFAGGHGALRDLALDAGFGGLPERPAFTLAGGGRRVTVTFAEGYPYAQVFVPPGKQYVAVEPMTAPANALVSGRGLRTVEPDATFRASFRIEIAAS